MDSRSSACLNSLSLPTCRCPEYEPQSDNLDAPCDLCDHAPEWHAPPPAVDSNEARERKARGEEVLERCKDRLGDGRECPCPVFVRGDAGDCLLCGHKRGWHKWKDSQSVLDSPPSPHTFRVGSYGPFPPSSSGSSRASTASHYTNPPSAHSSPPSSEAWSAAGSPILSPQGSAWNHLPPPTQRLPSPPQHPSRPPPRRPSSSSTQHSPTDYFQPPLLPIHIHGVRPAPRSTNERGGTSEEDLVRDPGHLSRAGSLVGGGRRAGSTASGEDARTETMGARTPTLSLGQEELELLPVWRDYDGHSMTLSVSPPLDGGIKFRPGQVFQFRLELKHKVSLSSFDKLEVRLIGNSHIYGEPPEIHDFLSIRTPIIHGDQPLSTFSWTTTLPDSQNCDCRPDPLPLPPSFTHPGFCIAYRVELVAKKSSRFLKMGPIEKFRIPFLVEAPPSEGLRFRDSAIDGPWRRNRFNQLVLVHGQTAAITGSELAWQILPSQEGLVRIPYRVSFIFGPLPPTQQLNEEGLTKLVEATRITMDRRVVFSGTGKKGGKEVHEGLGEKMTERRGESGVEDVEEVTVWRFEGSLEVPEKEGRSLRTCKVEVLHMLAATALPSAGISSEISLVAPSLNLELPTNPLPRPPPPATQHDAPQPRQPSPLARIHAPPPPLLSTRFPVPPRRRSVDPPPLLGSPTTYNPPRRRSAPEDHASIASGSTSRRERTIGMSLPRQPPPPPVSEGERDGDESDIDPRIGGGELDDFELLGLPPPFIDDAGFWDENDGRFGTVSIRA